MLSGSHFAILANFFNHSKNLMYTAHVKEGPGGASLLGEPKLTSESSSVNGIERVKV